MNFIRSFFLGVWAKCRTLLTVTKKQAEIADTIIPTPQKTAYTKTSYTLQNQIQLQGVFWDELTDVITLFENEFSLTFIKNEENNAPKSTVIDIHLDDTFSREGYLLSLQEKITIYSRDVVGARYALYSLFQLLRKKEAGIEYKGGTIEDSPKYSWRGVHIDVARHFFPIQTLYKLVDTLSFYKLNTLHLHLTDDQGWRVESKLFPKLHEIGSHRPETVIGKYFPFFGFKYKGDNTPYAGYYTQNELKDLDQYAQKKGVTIVPEVDIPGHATAALSAYPEYSADKIPHHAATYWGIFSNVFSPKPESVTFLSQVIDEVSSLFSSSYIHLGGDEVPAKSYKKDAYAKKLIKSGEVESFEKIDHYILKKVVANCKKTPIVWDEAREVVGDSGVTMIWRDNTYAKEVLAKGGKVILSPTTHFYFDYYQHNPSTEPLAIGGYLPIEQVYGYSAPEEQNGRILGIQANLWTEYIPDESHLWYMLLPRLYALSEVAWGTNTNLTSFLERVKNKKKVI